MPSDAARFENLIASHLLKWVHFEQDARGLDLDLRYFRDTDGREVDFVITERGRPQLLVECKWADAEVDRSLRYPLRHFVVVEDCLQPMWRGKFLYDPRPKLTALQHDPRTRESHLKWLKGIVDNKVVMGRGQTENVEKLAAGEYPLFCGANYHSTLREADQGAPVGLVIPDPYPMEFGTQMRIVKWTQTPATMQLFALWLATKGEQPAYREFPWKPDSRKYPMVKGKYMAVCEVECLRKAEFYEKEHARIIGLPGAR